MTAPDSRTEAIPRDRIQKYLRQTAPDADPARVMTLSGDASNRRYVRVVRPDRESIVLALYAEPFEYESLPFVNVAELLRQIPVPVPAILGHAGDLGILSLEDLGDATLQVHVGASPAQAHAALYRAAVDLICVLQRRGAELRSPRFLPYTVQFDEDKLIWELNYFVEHFLRGHRGALLAQPDQKALAEEFGRLAQDLTREPRVLCHRDYHSRNLMVHARRLYMIDFQDARLGPDTYDLVSLLRDSYVDLPEPMVDELIRYFVTKRDVEESVEDFRQRFDVMALQRTLKALGTFGYHSSVRGNPVYVQYMPRTLRHVRDNLRRYPRWDRLHAILAAYLEELR